jgi:hypothetical protein
MMRYMGEGPKKATIFGKKFPLMVQIKIQNQRRDWTHCVVEEDS